MAFIPCGRIDTHLHLAYENGDRGERVISTYKEMLHHFEKLNIVKGIVLPGGEMLSFLPGNEECEAIYRADPAHFAWMCNPEPWELPARYPGQPGFPLQQRCLHAETSERMPR